MYISFKLLSYFARFWRLQYSLIRKIRRKCAQKIFFFNFTSTTESWNSFFVICESIKAKFGTTDEELKCLLDVKIQLISFHFFCGRYLTVYWILFVRVLKQTLAWLITNLNVSLLKRQNSAYIVSFLSWWIFDSLVDFMFRRIKANFGVTDKELKYILVKASKFSLHFVISFVVNICQFVDFICES